MRFTRAVFIRCIGGIFLLAFLSAAVQMLGLYGSHGILPVNDRLAQAHGHPLLELLLNFPSIFWFDSSDSFLVFVPLIGSFFSLLALCGILSGPCILVSWFLYLSIVTVGQEFMSFQWDILILETGFLCIFLASWRPFDFLYWQFGNPANSSNDLRDSPSDEPVDSNSNLETKSDVPKWNSKLPPWTIDRVEPPLPVIRLCRWLLFRLMFQSGLCKLESGDETWRNLTAMKYHYETQPLPTPIGWFAHQLPDPVLQLSTVFVFVLELFLPLLIFAGVRARLAVAIGIVALQILILLTGNYCFFNLLTIALCLLLVDDARLLHLQRLRFRPTAIKSETDPRIAVVPIERPNQLRDLVIVPVTILIVFLSSSRILFTAGGARGMPAVLYSITEICQPWHLVSGYGLFAMMTTTRPEISIEGSLDGKTWKEYVFKYKPGPLDRAPPIVAPHQPRLDWQMWFAALGTVSDNPWLISFAVKLLDRSPDVLALLQSDPFHGERPKYIRANVYDYHMEDIGTLLSTGRWWKRTYSGVYLPAITKTSVHIQ